MSVAVPSFFFFWRKKEILKMYFEFKLKKLGILHIGLHCKVKIMHLSKQFFSK